MKEYDFSSHNAEVAEVWNSYHAGTPIRVPMILGTTPRIWLLDPALNAEKITFKQYMTQPEIMLRVQLQCDDYIRHNLYSDRPMGLPKKGWEVQVDFQNIYEAAWYGAELRFFPNENPVSKPMLEDKNKSKILSQPFPKAFSGIMGRGLEFYEYFCNCIKKGYDYRGVPLAHASPLGIGTDGPMTVACNLRGTTEFCLDIMEDPEYAKELLSYITEATIQRIQEQRRYFGMPLQTDSFYFADDSIMLLSEEMYKELVLPFHKRLLTQLTHPGSKNAIHLCGNATRHFKTIRDELNVFCFDTGFPVSHGALCEELGPEVTVQGGVHVDILLNSSPQEIAEETGRILNEVMPVTKRFIMRDANDLSPCTPSENVRAMYEAVRAHRY